MSVVRVEVTGELDLATAPELLERVRTTLVDRPGAIVLDLAGVTFCDSSGINALVDAHTLAGADGTTLRVANAQRITLRALEVTGVLPLLTGV
jgi:anti-sigma B factor antagonist